MLVAAFLTLMSRLPDMSENCHQRYRTPSGAGNRRAEPPLNGPVDDALGSIAAGDVAIDDQDSRITAHARPKETSARGPF
jgi:hypothetical protein